MFANYAIHENFGLTFRFPSTGGFMMMIHRRKHETGIGTFSFAQSTFYRIQVESAKLNEIPKLFCPKFLAVYFEYFSFVHNQISDITVVVLVVVKLNDCKISNWIYRMCTYFVFIFIFVQLTIHQMGSFACKIHEIKYRIISQWIELPANPPKTMNEKHIILNTLSVLWMHYLFTHVIKGVANSICKQIFDNGYCSMKSNVPNI